MTDHVIAHITFPESSKAYEALSDLKRAGLQGRIVIDAAVILEREPDGALHIAESQDSRLGQASLAGSVIGALVGVLGGPFGILLGWGGGLLGGTMLEARRVNRTESLLGRMSELLLPGETAIVAEVHELAPEVLDGVMTPLGGQVNRFDAEQVVSDLEAAEAAAESARREADRVLRQQRRDEVKQDLAERVEALRKRFSKE